MNQLFYFSFVIHFENSLNSFFFTCNQLKRIDNIEHHVTKKDIDKKYEKIQLFINTQVINPANPLKHSFYYTTLQKISHIPQNEITVSTSQQLN